VWSWYLYRRMVSNDRITSIGCVRTWTHGEFRKDFADAERPINSVPDEVSWRLCVKAIIPCLTPIQGPPPRLGSPIQCSSSCFHHAPRGPAPGDEGKAESKSLHVPPLGRWRWLC
jgi:hypothetical protein